MRRHESDTHRRLQCVHGGEVSADRIIERILVREGGWSDRPNDHGGATNWGITLPFLSDRLGRPATIEELRALTREQSAGHYRDWLTATRLDGLCHYDADSSMADAVIDWAVQSSQSAAVKLLQRALGFTGSDVDGVLGSQTFAAYDAVVDPWAVVRGIVTQRVQHRVRKVVADATQLEFLMGWVNRDLSFLFGVGK